MSDPLVLGLAIQATALVIALAQARGRWLGRVDILFLGVSILFHGATEVVQVLLPGRDFYRALIRQSDLEGWVMTVSVSILLFSISYTTTMALKSPRAKRAIEKTAWLGPFDWQLILVLILPAYLVTISGQGEAQLGYLAAGLGQQFAVLGIMVLFTMLYVKSGFRMPLVFLVLQSLALVLLGQRLTVVVGVVAFLTFIARFRTGSQSRILLAGLGLMAMMGLTITLGRFVLGRETLTGNVQSRLTGIGAGLNTLLNSPSGDSASQALINDFAYRFDGNSFGTLLYGRLADGRPGVGLQTLWNNLYLAIPRFLIPGKLDSDLGRRNEKYFLTTEYALPGEIDYLPMTFGILFSYYGIPGLLIASVLLGWVFAQLDLWLARKMTSTSILIGVGLTYVAVFMEQGVQVYFITFRTIFALIFLLFFFNLVVNQVRRFSIRKPQPAENAPLKVSQPKQ